MRPAAWPIMLAWTSTRLWCVVLLVLLPRIPFDIELYAAWGDGIAAGSFPAGDPRWQYPDPVGLLLLPIGVVDRPIPVFVAMALAADLAIMLAILRRWRRDPASSSWGPWSWALAGLWIGGVLLTRLDVFPTLLAVLALLATRPWAVGALAGLGAGLKLWPAAALAMVERRRLVAAVAGFAVALAGSFLVARLIAPAGDSFLAGQASRGLHAEAVGALPFVAASLIGHPAVLVESHGTIEVAAPAAPIVSLAVMLAGFAVIAVLAILRWTGRLGAEPVDVVAAIVLVLLASSRVLSPQFATWALGVLAIALLSPRTRLRGPAVLAATSALVAQLVYPLDLGWGTSEAPAVIAQVVRVGLWLWATCWAVAAVLRRAPQPAGGAA